jgi:hypothetical protein
MSDTFPTNLCTDCRCAELVTAEEQSVRLCCECYAAMVDD